jgi:tetratricopeptide (TPR) repeat protein
VAQVAQVRAVLLIAYTYPRMETPKLVTCVRCGTGSEVGEGYRKVKGALRCPPCSQQRLIKIGLWSWALIPVMVAAGFLFIRLVPRDAIGWLYLNLSLFVIFEALLILPHEVGHALAARAVGFRVFRIMVGAGHISLKKWVGGTLLDFRPLPVGGATLVGPGSPGQLGAKLFLIFLAGPLVNGLLVAVALLWTTPKDLSPAKCGSSMQPMFDFIAANALLIIINLIPRKVRTPQGDVDSDGLGLLRAFAIPQERREEMLSSTFALEGWVCLEQSRYTEALAWYEKGLKEHPASAVLRNDRAVALFNLRRFEEAREAFLDLLRNPALKPVVRAFALNNVAAADIYLLPARSDLLEEADRYSGEALRKMGWMAIFQGTRGAVLIELGRVDEGLALARKAFEGSETARVRAIVACTLAIGLHAKGKNDEAKEQLAIARGLNPQCLLLPRAEQALEEKTL